MAQPKVLQAGESMASINAKGYAPCAIDVAAAIRLWDFQNSAIDLSVLSCSVALARLLLPPPPLCRCLLLTRFLLLRSSSRPSREITRARVASSSASNLDFLLRHFCFRAQDLEQISLIFFFLLSLRRSNWPCSNMHCKESRTVHV